MTAVGQFGVLGAVVQRPAAHPLKLELECVAIPFRAMEEEIVLDWVLKLSLAVFQNIQVNELSYFCLVTELAIGLQP